jgi:hypothetical protein
MFEQKGNLFVAYGLVKVENQDWNDEHIRNQRDAFWRQDTKCSIYSCII